ncbi:MAG: SPOR domain-containing protein [Candidatus Aminicenantes bacterium]|nr:SPOR domain-containing protein [Candidatus Aminicenantes bacterium]
MERTYFEFKITFVHIVVFLVAVMAIGIFLFYMGYKAGQRRSDPRTVIANEADLPAAGGELQVVDEKPLKTAEPGRSIPREMQLHQEQARKEVPAPEPKPAEVQVRYTIQVGAFAEFANAQRCSRKFTSLGYQAAIITDNQKKLHTVQVGNFASLAEAQAEKTKLESLEKSKFTIKKSR